jgi:hypothetical protein
MKWFSTENTPTTRYPEWARSFAVTEDGVMMLPAALADGQNEALVAIAACEQTGAATTAHLGHLYVSSTWLKSEYPQIRELVEGIEATIRQMGVLPSNC